MATPTSSSNRSKRKTNKPITQGQNPQRANRQKVSNAKVSNADQRTNTGSAKVTTGRSESKPSAPKALPPGNKGGPLATQGRGPLRGQAQIPPGRKGGGMEKAGPTVDVKANTPKLKAGAPKPPAGMASRIASGAGRLLGAAGAAAAIPLELKAMADRQKRWDDYKARNNAGTKKDANGRSSTGTRVSDKANNRDYKAAPTGSQQYNDYRNQQLAAERERLKGVGNTPSRSTPSTPKPKAQTARPAGTQPSRPSTPAAPKKPASPASPKDRRVSAATANREAGNYGTSRTNNPMIDESMKTRMRQREDAAGVGPVKDGARYAADVKNNTKGVGPIKDGERYAGNLKPSDKTKSDKGMTLAEKMRRRRMEMG